MRLLIPDPGRRIAVAWILVCGSFLGLGCQSRSKHVTERIALWNEAEAIEARHQSLDNEIAAWSESLGAWARKNAITIDPARLVLSLSSRSYFLHQPHPPSTTETDPEYAHLEDQMKEIQAKQRQIEADWQALLARDRASNDRAGVKPVEVQRTFEYDFGDSTIPIPGVSARQSCCSLTATFPGETGCKLLLEYCQKPSTAGGKWQRVCWYICDPKVISTAR
jgi:hypothetical protein